jgi:hypothetical protein
MYKRTGKDISDGDIKNNDKNNDKKKRKREKDSNLNHIMDLNSNKSTVKVDMIKLLILRYCIFYVS